MELPAEANSDALYKVSSHHSNQPDQWRESDQDGRITYSHIYNHKLHAYNSCEGKYTVAISEHWDAGNVGHSPKAVELIKMKIFIVSSSLLRVMIWKPVEIPKIGAKVNAKITWI